MRADEVLAAAMRCRLSAATHADDAAGCIHVQVEPGAVELERDHLVRPQHARAARTRSLARFLHHGGGRAPADHCLSGLSLAGPRCGSLRRAGAARRWQLRPAGGKSDRGEEYGKTGEGCSSHGRRVWQKARAAERRPAARPRRAPPATPHLDAYLAGSVRFWRVTNHTAPKHTEK